MIREIAPGYQVTNSANPDEIKVIVHLAGLSTDTKPIDVNYATGSDFLEVDTGDVYLYDEVTDGGKWHGPVGGDS